MSVLINGTNGLIQAYDYQVLTTGFSYTFAAGTQTLVINPATTLAAGTITMPASPSDGMTITFSSTKQITALTLNGNTGQTVVSAVTVLPANQATTYIYRATNTTWYPMSTVATNAPVSGGGSAINSGTIQTSTSGTSIDFTGIPSWVKRITVMFNGVSTNGTSATIIQLGDSGGVETSGYLGSMSYQGAQAFYTTGIGVNNTGSASAFRYGSTVITLVDSSTNTWSAMGVVGTTGIGTGETYSSGSVKSLSSVLDRIRITTVNGTDAFDAGSINILYE